MIAPRSAARTNVSRSGVRNSNTRAATNDSTLATKPASTPSAASLLVDTGSSPAQGAQLRADVVELTGADPAHVVISHAHRDHWFGLAAFAGFLVTGTAVAGMFDSISTVFTSSVQPSP